MLLLTNVIVLYVVTYDVEIQSFRSCRIIINGTYNCDTLIVLKCIYGILSHTEFHSNAFKSETPDKVFMIVTLRRLLECYSSCYETGPRHATLVKAIVVSVSRYTVKINVQYKRWSVFSYDRLSVCDCATVNISGSKLSLPFKHCPVSSIVHISHVL